MGSVRKRIVYLGLIILGYGVGVSSVIDYNVFIFTYVGV